MAVLVQGVFVCFARARARARRERGQREEEQKVENAKTKAWGGNARGWRVLQKLLGKQRRANSNSRNVMPLVGPQMG